MRIGELADAVGVNPKTIRYYEDIDLLPAPDRTPAGYRLYAEEDIGRLAFIRRAQQLDLHLDEIREILALREHDQRPCGYVAAVARQRVEELERRLAQTRRARDELQALLDRADGLGGGTAGYCRLIEHHTAPNAEDQP